MAVSFFRHADYKAARPKVIALCKQQYCDFLRRMHPNDPIERISAFVDEVIKQDMRVPQVDLIRHPSPGNTVRETVPLTVHINRDIRNRIISPSGSVYYLPSEHESFLRITIAKKKKERSKFKKIMLACKEAGDDLQAAINNYLQSNAKVINNSFAGALNSQYNILYDKANFASTTSISRQSVKCGYSHIELFLGGNLLLFSYDDIVSYSLRQCKVLDCTHTAELIAAYKLHIPTEDEVSTFFLESIRNYVLIPPEQAIRAFVATLTPVERAKVFYSGCLKNLVFFNDGLFRPYFDTLFDVEGTAPAAEVTIKDIYKIDPDVLMLVRSLHSDVLGVDSEDRIRSFESALEENPEGLRLFLGIAHRYTELLEELAPIFSGFLRVDSDLPKLHEHPVMVRTNTLISDTDSAIFTTQNFVEWYSGKLSFDPASFAINAFTVFAVVKTLEHRFARLSCGFGMEGKDVYGINMKNEFFMAVLVRTNIKKHYASLNMYQEGKILPVPKIDIKGVQFRDSKLSAFTNQKVSEFIGKIFDDVTEKGTIVGADYLREVRQFELAIYKETIQGKRTFLKTDPIKKPEEYSDDPMKSSYFYFDLWDKVFVPDFDRIIIPTKCYVLPLRNDGRCLDDPEWRAQLKKAYPEVHRRLLAYLAESKESKRKITRIALPPSISEIPKILLPLVDMRAVIFTNCQPFYLALKSIGFALNFAPDKFLVADFFEADKDFSIPYE